MRENNEVSRLHTPLRISTPGAGRLWVAGAVGVFSLAGVLVGLATADSKSAFARPALKHKLPTAQQYEQAILKTQKEIDDLQNEIGQEVGVDVAVLVVLSPFELPLALHCLLIGKDVKTVGDINKKWKLLDYDSKMYLPSQWGLLADHYPKTYKKFLYGFNLVASFRKRQAALKKRGTAAKEALKKRQSCGTPSTAFSVSTTAPEGEPAKGSVKISYRGRSGTVTLGPNQLCNDQLPSSQRRTCREYQVPLLTQVILTAQAGGGSKFLFWNADSACPFSKDATCKVSTPVAHAECREPSRNPRQPDSTSCYAEAVFALVPVG